MIKSNWLFFLCTIALFTSCDVRKKDKESSLKDKGLTQQIVIKDPTAVQIIDSVYDFGKVTDGEIVEYSFRFKNVGTKPLIISNASASCGCTVPEKPEQPIKPGELGFIKVKFNSEKRVGMAHKTVNVSSNAEPAFPELLLKGEVLAKPDSK